MRKLYIYLIFILFLTSCNKKIVGTWISVDSEQIIITSTSDLGIIIDFDNKKAAHIASDTTYNIFQITKKDIIINENISFKIESLSDDTLRLKDDNTIYKFIELKDSNVYSLEPKNLYNTKLELIENFSFVLDSTLYRNGIYGNVRDLIIKKKEGEKVNGYWLINDYLGHYFLLFHYYDTEVLIFKITTNNNANFSLVPINKDCFGLIDKKEYRLINN